jgi:hypothetical protein
VIQEAFYNVAHPGIIPYVSWADAKKLKKSAEKAEKKAQHKRREKQQATPPVSSNSSRAPDDAPAAAASNVDAPSIAIGVATTDDASNRR